MDNLMGEPTVTTGSLPLPHHKVGLRYGAMVSAGEIDDDPSQRAIAARLDRLNAAIAEHRLARKSSALGWLFAKNRAKEPPLKGLYIWGGVGRGKTMLMDLFFELCPLNRKRRAHFHAFMTDVHERIHAHRQALKAGETNVQDPIPPVAEAIASDALLLCFDEFFVVDIADAMILGRLFTELFSRGVVLVATSNVEPSQLYLDGLNRPLFLPFLDLLAERVDIVEMDAEKDYRLDKLAAAPTWYVPLGPVADHAMDESWERLTSGAKGAATHLKIKGRHVEVPKHAAGVARFSFSDLCERPLGAEDFLTIARRFNTVMIDRIPTMDASKRNEAKRFITLVDALYDEGTKLVASAGAEPHDLYKASSGNEAFAFDRTASRLMDMRSEAYLSAPRGLGSFSDV